MLDTLTRAVGSLTIDIEKRLITRDGRSLRVTPKEYDLLAVLARNAGTVVTHRQILSAGWSAAHCDDTQHL